jgi:hypothetical protein
MASPAPAIDAELEAAAAVWLPGAGGCPAGFRFRCAGGDAPGHAHTTGTAAGDKVAACCPAAAAIEGGRGSGGGGSGGRRAPRGLPLAWGGAGPAGGEGAACRRLKTRCCDFAVLARTDAEPTPLPGEAPGQPALRGTFEQAGGPAGCSVNSAANLPGACRWPPWVTLKKAECAAGGPGKAASATLVRWAVQAQLDRLEMPS